MYHIKCHHTDMKMFHKHHLSPVYMTYSEKNRPNGLYAYHGHYHSKHEALPMATKLKLYGFRKVTVEEINR